MTTTYDPFRLVAETEVHLHQAGVATVAGGGVSAVQAAAALLRALGVEPVDEHRQICYRVQLAAILQEGVAVDERHAEDFAHALRMLPAARSGRASVIVEAVPVPLRDAL